MRVAGKLTRCSLGAAPSRKVQTAATTAARANNWLTTCTICVTLVCQSTSRQGAGLGREAPQPEAAQRPEAHDEGGQVRQRDTQPAGVVQRRIERVQGRLEG